MRSLFSSIFLFVVVQGVSLNALSSQETDYSLVMKVSGSDLVSQDGEGDSEPVDESAFITFINNNCGTNLSDIDEFNSSQVSVDCSGISDPANIPTFPEFGPKKALSLSGDLSNTEFLNNVTDVGFAGIEPSGNIPSGAFSGFSQADSMNLIQPVGGSSTWNFNAHSANIEILELPMIVTKVGECSDYSGGHIKIRDARSEIPGPPPAFDPGFNINCYSGKISSDTSKIGNITVDSSKGVDFSGMTKLTDANSIHIRNSSEITSISGFNELKNVALFVRLENLPDLQSLSGLESLDTAHSVVLIDLPSLSTTNGLNQEMESITEFTIHNTPALTDLSALSAAIQSINERVNVEIRGNFGGDLSFLEPLSNVELEIDPDLADSIPLISASSNYCQNESSYKRFDENYQDGAGSSNKSSMATAGVICES